MHRSTLKSNIEKHIRVALANARENLSASDEWREVQDGRDKFILFACHPASFQVVDDGEIYFEIEEPTVVPALSCKCVVNYFDSLHVKVRFLTKSTLVYQRALQYLVVTASAESIKLLMIDPDRITKGTLSPPYSSDSIFQRSPWRGTIITALIFAATLVWTAR
jgi:hypothetical protein